MKNKIYFRLIVVLLTTAVLFGCKDDAATGPDVVSDMKAYSGDLRAKVEFQAPATATSGRVFFGSGKFTEFTITDIAAKQSIVVEGLNEGEQIIRVVTYDASGAKSDPKGVKVSIYGDKYKGGLVNRKMVTQNIITETSIEMLFESAMRTEVEVRIVFTGTSGQKDSVMMKSSENSITINNIDMSKAYDYYTVYKPDATAIDEFCTVKVDAKKAAAMNFEKAKWRVIAQSSQDATYTVNYAIDNDISTLWHSDNSVTGPHWITVDMLSEKLCNGFYFVQSQIKEEGGLARNIKFEVSTDNETWETVTEDVLAANRYRQPFTFRRPVMARYFKITILDGYNGATYSQIAEIDLFNELNKSGENGTDILLSIPLVNAKKPFTGDGSDRAPSVGAGRFQQVAGWTHENAYISYDGGSFCVWCAPVWGISDITNGKIYQTVTLKPGTYTLSINTAHTTDASCVDMYGVVASGETLPDYSTLTTVPQTLGYRDLVLYSQRVNEIRFTVAEEGPVTIGVVYNLHNKYETTATPWSDMNINSFELLVNE